VQPPFGVEPGSRVRGVVGVARGRRLSAREDLPFPLRARISTVASDDPHLDTATAFRPSSGAAERLRTSRALLDVDATNVGLSVGLQDPAIEARSNLRGGWTEAVPSPTTRYAPRPGLGRVGVGGVFVGDGRYCVEEASNIAGLMVRLSMPCASIAEWLCARRTCATPRARVRRRARGRSTTTPCARNGLATRFWRSPVGRSGPGSRVAAEGRHRRPEIRPATAVGEDDALRRAGRPGSGGCVQIRHPRNHRNGKLRECWCVERNVREGGRWARKTAHKEARDDIGGSAITDGPERVTTRAPR